MTLTALGSQDTTRKTNKTHKHNTTKKTRTPPGVNPDGSELVSLVYEGNGHRFCTCFYDFEIRFGNCSNRFVFLKFYSKRLFSTCEKKIVCIAKNDLKIQKEKNIQHKKTDIYS